MIFPRKKNYFSNTQRKRKRTTSSLFDKSKLSIFICSPTSLSSFSFRVKQAKKIANDKTLKEKKIKVILFINSYFDWLNEKD
jgi:hypothetical protein